MEQSQRRNLARGAHLSASAAVVCIVLVGCLIRRASSRFSQAPNYNYRTCRERNSEKPIRASGDEVIPCEDGGQSCHQQKYCGIAPMKPRIFSGQEATIGQWPSFVRLFLKAEEGATENRLCGGTLLTDRIVLTAAFCAHYFPGDIAGEELLRNTSNIKVVFEQVNYSNGSLDVATRNVKAIHVAKNYKQIAFLRYNDWALLELEEPAPFGMTTLPACLPFKPVKTKGEGSMCYVVASGLTGEEQHKDLKMARVEEDNESCNFGDPSLTCYKGVGESPGNICYGDNGAPVLCLNDEGYWTVVAIASFAPSCSEVSTGENAIYADLRSFLAQMKKQVLF